MPPYGCCCTIDDAPSTYTPQIVNALVQHSIPAVFFCRGSSIREHEASVLFAIQHGFLIGNHSYEHPYFSSLSIEECYKEILTTEEAIERCYRRAGVQRSHKIFRFPFGDPGDVKAPHDKEKKRLLQRFLQKEGFCRLQGASTYDIPWTLDTQDYKGRWQGNLQAYRHHLEALWKTASWDQHQIILIHDFDRTFQLFEVALNFFLEQHVRFLPLPLS